MNFKAFKLYCSQYSVKKLESFHTLYNIINVHLSLINNSDKASNLNNAYSIAYPYLKRGFNKHYIYFSDFIESSMWIINNK